MLERIYPKGNHQIPGFKFADVIQGVGQGLTPLTERRSGGHRVIPVKAHPCTQSRLVCIAKEMRESVFRVTMQRTKKHIIALVKDILRTVAMMEIHIQDGYTLRAAIQQILSRNRCIIEKTISAEHVPRRMMPRRTTQGEHSRLP